MSSNEEYLDSLLKSLTDETPNLTAEEEKPQQEKEDIDLAKYFSKEELEESFSEESALEKEENSEESVMDLLDTMGDDEDLAEINELLKKNDSNELVKDDMLDLFNENEEVFDELEELSDTELPEEINDIDIFAELDSFEEKQSSGEEESLESDLDFILNSQNETISNETKKEKRKREKEEKRKALKAAKEGKTGENSEEPKEAVQAEKQKSSFWARIIALLFEADEEEEFDVLAEGTVPSDENIAILQEVDQENGKKKKEKKMKKGKKGAEEGEKEGEEEGEKEEKPKKEKKPKKPKKEKKEAPKEEEKGKKVSKKKMVQVFIICFSFMAFLILSIQFIPSILDSMQGRNAYHQKDYVEAYQMFYGKKLNDSDEVLFHRAETILKLDRKYQSYLNYQKMEKPLEAIDALMQGVAEYPLLLVQAEEYAVTDEVKQIYADILSALEEFGVSEDIAKEINAYEDDYIYTKRLESIVFGTEFIDPNAPETVEPETVDPEILPDMLPEETVDTESNENMQDLLEEEMTMPATENNEIEIIDAEINIEE